MLAHNGMALPEGFAAGVVKKEVGDSGGERRRGRFGIAIGSARGAVVNSVL